MHLSLSKANFQAVIYMELVSPLEVIIY